MCRDEDDASDMKSNNFRPEKIINDETKQMEQLNSKLDRVLTDIMKIQKLELPKNSNGVAPGQDATNL